jgi:hypothetical protein
MQYQTIVVFCLLFGSVCRVHMRGVRNLFVSSHLIPLHATCWWRHYACRNPFGIIHKTFPGEKDGKTKMRQGFYILLEVLAATMAVSQSFEKFLNHHRNFGGQFSDHQRLVLASSLACAEHVYSSSRLLTRTMLFRVSTHPKTAFCFLEHTP